MKYDSHRYLRFNEPGQLAHHGDPAFKKLLTIARERTPSQSQPEGRPHQSIESSSYGKWPPTKAVKR
jgi:hypothetical protein